MGICGDGKWYLQQLSVHCTYANTRDLCGTRPRFIHRFIVISNNSLSYPSLEVQDMNSGISSWGNYWCFTQLSQGNECPLCLPGTEVFKELHRLLNGDKSLDFKNSIYLTSVAP